MPYIGPAVYSIDVAHLNSGFPLHGPPSSLEDLSLFQMQMLMDVIKYNASQEVIEPRFALAFASNNAVDEYAWTLLEQVKNAFDDLAKSPRLYDLNRDGVVSQDDRSLFDVFFAIGQAGQPWPIIMYFDGDGSLTERDKCMISTYVASH
jgi:hypothetical protein